jgi:hypothetical protein
MSDRLNCLSPAALTPAKETSTPIAYELWETSEPFSVKWAERKERSDEMNPAGAL